MIGGLHGNSPSALRGFDQSHLELVECDQRNGSRCRSRALSCGPDCSNCSFFNVHSSARVCRVTESSTEVEDATPRHTVSCGTSPTTVLCKRENGTPDGCSKGSASCSRFPEVDSIRSLPHWSTAVSEHYDTTSDVSLTPVSECSASPLVAATAAEAGACKKEAARRPSALKGTSFRPKDLRVTWAPDVVEPRSSAHLRTSPRSSDAVTVSWSFDVPCADSCSETGWNKLGRFYVRRLDAGGYPVVRGHSLSDRSSASAERRQKGKMNTSRSAVSRSLASFATSKYVKQAPEASTASSNSRDGSSRVVITAKAPRKAGRPSSKAGADPSKAKDLQVSKLHDTRSRRVAKASSDSEDSIYSVADSHAKKRHDLALFQRSVSCTARLQSDDCSEGRPLESGSALVSGRSLDDLPAAESEAADIAAGVCMTIESGVKQLLRERHCQGHKAAVESTQAVRFIVN